MSTEPETTEPIRLLRQRLEEAERQATMEASTARRLKERGHRATGWAQARAERSAKVGEEYREALAKLEEPEVQDSPEPKRQTISSYTGLATTKVGTRAVDGQGFTVRRVNGGWRYETSAAAGLFRHYEMEAHLPLLVVEQVAPDEGTPPTPRVPSRVIGRVMWDPAHPSPWVSFDNITQYQQWARAVRRELPGIRTQFAHLDWVHTADTLLSSAKGKREELAK